MIKEDSPFVNVCWMFRNYVEVSASPNVPGHEAQFATRSHNIMVIQWSPR